MESRTLLEQADRLAAEAVGQARSSLMIVAPFMDVALWRMPFSSAHLRASLGTNGRALLIDSASTIESFRRDPNEILRDYLHAILHCVFRHPFDGRHPDRATWDLACDIAVEAAAMELAATGFPSRFDDDRMRALAKIEAACSSLTAARIYRALASELPAAFVETLGPLFTRDDHDPWPRIDERAATRRRVDDRKQALPSDGSERMRGSDPRPEDDEEDDDRRDAGADSPGSPAPSASSTAVEGEVENGDSLADMDATVEGRASFASMDDVTVSDFEDMTWQDISQLIDMDMEGFTGKVGSQTGAFMVNLAIANRKRYDYRDFLKRFAALSEEMKVSTEEFDYIYYTYGLARYGNMPLVEPLEYQETNRIRDFVIAIDTSASCAGGLIRRFAESTYDVLKNSEGFGHKVNIHIVQCDCEVRSDTVVTELRDLQNAFSEFSTRGYGGTDFRPVFAYVDELVESRELANLKGLIYFTDGLGKYPQHPPDYETAFVFVCDDCRERPVPPWAMKVLLDEDDIYELDSVRGA